MERSRFLRCLLAREKTREMLPQGPPLPVIDLLKVNLFTVLLPKLAKLNWSVDLVYIPDQKDI